MENGYVSTYWYDADGERTVKEHGADIGHYVNSAGVDSLANTEQFTLYVNPYVVVSNDYKYTNHIYVDGMRVVSKVKDLDLSSFNGNDTHHAGYDMNEDVDYDSKYLDQREALKTNYRELGVPYNGTDHSPYQYFMLINGESGSDAGQQEGNGEAGGEGGLLRSPSTSHLTETDSLTFYYHPDHLGSTTYITDREGNPEQYLSYLPYGEVFIDKFFNDDYATPYKFNGKEHDEETGLYYYGARYLHPKYAMWLSTDPLEGKYPNLSSYSVDANNPIRYLDAYGDSLNLSNMMSLGTILPFSPVDNIINDLKSQTGLDLYLQPDGFLSYEKDLYNNPNLVDHKVSLWGGIYTGSETARNLLIKVIDSDETVYVNPGRRTGTIHGSNVIAMDYKQITSIINNTYNVDPRTLGWGMSLLHEFLHTKVGGLYSDTKLMYKTGDVVPIMNRIRSELNAQGYNYGQRTWYIPVYIQGVPYVPFSKAAAGLLSSGMMPSKHGYVVAH